MFTKNKFNSLPFTVIGGYLGAGKTTLLNHLLTNTQGLRIAALVNDFGSVNIDIDLIRTHKGNTINLANGCMCCSLVDGFASALGQIRQNSQDFDRIIIEASGVADPAKIAQYGQMYQLPLDGIIVVVDGEQVRIQANNKYVGDTVINQLTRADLIVLNKIDLVRQEDMTILKTWLNTIAPQAPVLEAINAQVAIDILLGSHHTILPLLSSTHSHSNIFETWTIELTESITNQQIERFAKGLGTNIYRAKGFVYFKNNPDDCHIYQQVGRRWTLTPSREAPSSRLVIIGRPGSTNREAIKQLLK